jgi:hypothetical protein
VWLFGFAPLLGVVRGIQIGYSIIVFFNEQQIIEEKNE